MKRTLLESFFCSTSLPGGNQVDGLPPAFSWPKHAWLRVILLACIFRLVCIRAYVGREIKMTRRALPRRVIYLTSGKPRATCEQSYWEPGVRKI